MIFSSKKTALRKERMKDVTELKRQIEISKGAILSAQSQFEQVVDPTLIDCYIYELNAAQLRYQFLLQRLNYRRFNKNYEALVSASSLLSHLPSRAFRRTKGKS